MLKSKKLSRFLKVGTRFASQKGMWSSATYRRRHRAAGFSLLEVLVVLVVFMILVAIVGPLTVRMMVRLRIESFADQVGNLIQRTRAQAVRENKIYLVEWLGQAVVPSGPYLEIEDWTDRSKWEIDETSGGASGAAVVLAADAHGLKRYFGARCLDPDGDGDDEAVAPPLFFDGIGAPLVVTVGGKLQPGRVAFCFADPPRASSGKSNVMQVRMDSLAGIVKVAKLIDDPAGTGERFADEAETFRWEWY